jgi:branched-subunit amino acid ABC-type transport system permease component
MKDETISVLYFLVLQNILFTILWVGGYQTALGQSVGNVIIGIAIILWFKHEEMIRTEIKKVVV